MVIPSSVSTATACYSTEQDDADPGQHHSRKNHPYTIAPSHAHGVVCERSHSLPCLDLQCKVRCEGYTAHDGGEDGEDQGGDRHAWRREEEGCEHAQEGQSRANWMKD